MKNARSIMDIHDAVCLVHTCNGPVACCEEHANKVEALMSFLGAATNRTPLEGEPIRCTNCINEARN